MSEVMVAPDIEKEAQEFKAGKTGEEAWAEKMIARGAEERKAGEAESEEQRREDEEKIRKSEEAEVKETKPERNLEARDSGRGVAQIPPEFTIGGRPVKMEFREAPKEGTVMYLEKPREYIEKLPSEGSEITESQIKFFRAESPKDIKGEVQKWVKDYPEAVFINPLPVNPEEVEARRAEAVNMRDYLTEGTLKQIKNPEGVLQPA